MLRYLFIVLIFCSQAVFASDTTLIDQLPKAKLIQKVQLIEQLSQDSATVLQALLNAKLYYIKSNKQVVLIQKNGAKLDAFNYISGERIQTFSKRKLKKITINNKIRGIIKTKLSLFALTSNDASQRLKAVENMYDKLDGESLNVLADLITKETDEKVKEAMTMAVHIGNLQSSTKSIQLNAIKQLDGNTHPQVKQNLLKIQTNDREITKSIDESLRSIEQKITIYESLQTLFFGLSYGSILVLVAIGLTITFGVMGVINMAHGELVMIGAYTAYMVQSILPQYIDMSLFIAIPLAFVVAGIFGMLIELFIVRNLKGRILETLLATFGVSLILQQLVRTVFSPLNQPVSTPSWMSGSLEINSVLSLTYNRIYITIFCLAVFVVLLIVMKKTRLGLEARAVSQDKNMASAMGIKTNRVNLLTFGLGAGIAGIAGVALSQLTNVGPNLGQNYIVDSFLVVVFGGVGNLFGTLVSGLSIGILSKFIEPWVGAVIAKILILIGIILFIQKRPKGLFPQRGRSVD